MEDVFSATYYVALDGCKVMGRLHPMLRALVHLHCATIIAHYCALAAWAAYAKLASLGTELS